MHGFSGWINQIKAGGAKASADRDRADPRSFRDQMTSPAVYAERAQKLYVEARKIMNLDQKELTEANAARLRELAGEIIYATRRIRRVGGGDLAANRMLINTLGSVEAIMRWGGERNIEVYDEEDRKWIEDALYTAVGDPDPTMFLFTTGLQKDLEIVTLRFLVRRMESLVASKQTPTGKESKERAQVEKNIQYIITALPRIDKLQIGTEKERRNLGYALGRVMQLANGKGMEIWLPKGFDRSLIPRTDPDA